MVNRRFIINIKTLKSNSTSCRSLINNLFLKILNPISKKYNHEKNFSFTIKFCFNQRTHGTASSYAAKSIGEWSLLDGKLTRYDDYGNLLYGYMGHYIGITQSDLDYYSNLQQKWQNIKSFNFSGDESRDTYKINEGYGWYKE